MDRIPTSTIHAVAEAISVTGLSDEAAKALAPDVDYRLREIVQDAAKCARHAKRTKITTDDINQALKMRNVEPMYGFSGSKDKAKFLRAAAHPEVCIAHDRELTFDQILEAPMPKPPVEIGLLPHWLFIDGSQPLIPENVAVDKPVPLKRERSQRTPLDHTIHKMKRGLDSKAGAPGSSAPPASAARQEVPMTAIVPARGVEARPVSLSASALASGGAGVQVLQPIQHQLSKELQLYFDKVVLLVKAPAPATVASSSAVNRSVEEDRPKLLRAAYESLSSDPGIHPLAPYFAKFVSDEVASSLKSLTMLESLLSLVSSLLSNPHIEWEHYIHQLLPPILTCLVAKSLGSHALDDHWAIRDAAAAVVGKVCARFNESFYNVRPRISKTLVKAFLDSAKPLPTHYGAVIGLSALGHASVSLLLIPHLQPYMVILAPLVDQTSSSLSVTLQQRVEANRVHGAILDAVSGAIRERILASSTEVRPEKPSTDVEMKDAEGSDDSLANLILSESWKEDADLGKTMWALQHVLPSIMTRLPLAHPPSLFL
jgi:transcription initiation factor TFIID subunit 6